MSDEFEMMTHEEDSETIRLRFADSIVSSEAFTWLMVGANHPDSHIKALQEYYDKWMALGGKSIFQRRD